MATTATASFPLSPRASPPPSSTTSNDMRKSTTSSSTPASASANVNSPYAVRDIPPFRPRVQRTSTDASNSTSTSTSRATNLHGSTSSNTRERRTSQASNNSGGGDSRRNSGQYISGRAAYPSPAPSSPASSSPTIALAQFFPSSSTLPAGLSSLSTSTSSSTAPGNNNNVQASSATAGGYYANPALANSIGPGAFTQHHQQAQTYQYYSPTTGAPAPSPGLAMLQGIEAQLQMPPYITRSGSSSGHSHRASMSAAAAAPSSSSSNSSTGNTRRQSSGIPLPSPSPGLSAHTQQQLHEQQQQQQDSMSNRVSGPTHRIPATHQTTHRPASTTIVPVNTQMPSLLASPPMQYPQQQNQHQQYRQTPSSSHTQQQYLLYTSSANTAPQLSQSTRAPFPAPLVVPPLNTAQANVNSTSAGPSYNSNNSRNRASHQIVPISASANAPPQIPTIALHTAQYSNPGRQKIFFGDYQLLHTLGEGEFGKVKLGVHAQRYVHD